MKRAVLIGLGLLMSLALVAPASALVFVFADIEKTKDVTVVENITITKTATIDVNVTALGLLSAAEALALANQENLSQDVSELETEKEALIQDAIGTGTKDDNSGNAGIVAVNQSVGNMNNQGANVAVALIRDEVAFANAEASASQISALNSVFEELTEKTDDILDSVNWNQGIVGVNQASGNAANQLNNVALAVGLVVKAGGVPVALSEADLGQFSANLDCCDTAGDGSVFQFDVVKFDTIDGSVLGHQGIVGVNQTGGNMDQQMNNVAVAASVTP